MEKPETPPVDRMSRLRWRFTVTAALVGAAYFLLFKLEMSPWSLDIVFLIVALVFWLARGNPALRAVAIGIPLELWLRRISGGALFVIFSAILFLAGLVSVKYQLTTPLTKKSGTPSLKIRIFETAGVLVLVVLIGIHVVGPILFMLDHGKRWRKLTAMAPDFLPLETLSLSPLATRLKNHVVALAVDIGERAAYQPSAQAKARAYIQTEFEKAGYAVKLHPYYSQRLYYVKDGTEFFNIEATLGSGTNPANGVLLIGAHYDTAPGTRGADDNASGVAVLLEVARLLKDQPLDREVRFVAFGTEEPPAFGTQNMGSYRYARKLRTEGTPVAGLINLEMLGYFNPKKGSQLYPPFLHLFFPDDGNFIAIVANFSSRSFFKSVTGAWPDIKGLPMKKGLLPVFLSGVTLSDHLNFWNEGFQAVMVSDTAFFRNPHYHENSDTAEKLNYEKMAGITQALVEVLLKFPGGSSREPHKDPRT